MRVQEAQGEGRVQARPSARVLLLYTDADQVPDLMRCLSSERYQVISCPIAAPRERWMTELEPDLVVLLPPDDDMELLDICEVVREGTDQPLLVLSERSGEVLIARVLASGVDEYLVMPIGNRELTARIDAMLRRMNRSAAPVKVRDLGALRLDPHDQTVTIDGRQIPLSPIEFRLISCLASAPGEVLTHRTIMSRVWGDAYVDSRNYLHLYVRYLREKLEQDPQNPRLIVSQWGVGYRLDVPEQGEESAFPVRQPASITA